MFWMYAEMNVLLYWKSFLTAVIGFSDREKFLENKLITGWPQHVQIHKGEQ